MKILAIRGKNIASLDGEFSVDFTCDPLFSAGLFAITGPTGAGKSTLLDVLCLALFDKTPRMNRARENGVLLPDVQDKERFMLMYFEKLLECIVSTVENIRPCADDGHEFNLFHVHTSRK